MQTISSSPVLDELAVHLRSFPGPRQHRARLTRSLFCQHPLSVPLDGAAHAGGLLRGAFACACDGLHGVAQFWCAMGSLSHACVIEPASVLKPTFAVVTEKVRGALCVVGLRHLLTLVEQIGEGEVVSFGELAHVFRAVGGEAAVVIGHDGGHTYALLLQSREILNQAHDDAFDVGTVVANKGQQYAISLLKLFKGDEIVV